MDLPFTAPALLAPMEGVTDPAFRDLVLERHSPDELGGAFTEFVRVVREPLPPAHIERHLGARRFPIPVGVQLMGSDLDALGETARRAAEVGAPVVDLNFGCPAKGALRTCAGAALLRDPGQVEGVVSAVARAVAGAVPVTAKIRAGYDDADLVEDLARAAQAGGAALLTVHCRTRAEAYCDEVDWTRIARAKAAVTIPVCGNGGVNSRADLERMRAETGVEYVMIGRAALGNPWVFSGREVAPREAAEFLVQYVEAMHAATGASPRQLAARIKQLVKTWTAGGFLDAAERLAWMREQDPGTLLGSLERVAERKLAPSAPAPARV